MGYETTMHVGEIYDWGDDPVKGMGEILRIDLCKIGNCNLSRLKVNSGTPAYLWASDGNTKITKDLYDADLYHIPFAEALEAVNKDADSDSYRRFEIAKAALNAIAKGFPDHSRLTVVLFGH